LFIRHLCMYGFGFRYYGPSYCTTLYTTLYQQHYRTAVHCLLPVL
jgi:hypothetical protein